MPRSGMAGSYGCFIPGSILKEISPVCSLEGLMLKLKHQYFGHLMWRADSFEKTLMLGKIEGRRKRGQQDEMVGWHHWLDGHGFGWTPGVGDGQGGLACCSYGVAKSWRWLSNQTEVNWIKLSAEFCQRLFLQLLRLSYGFYISIC